MKSPKQTVVAVVFIIIIPVIIATISAALLPPPLSFLISGVGGFISGFIGATIYMA